MSAQRGKRVGEVIKRAAAAACFYRRSYLLMLLLNCSQIRFRRQDGDQDANHAAEVQTDFAKRPVLCTSTRHDFLQSDATKYV